MDPYLAVGLQTKIKHVTSREEVKRNLNHIGNMIDMVTHMCSLELPVRLIALGEGAPSPNAISLTGSSREHMWVTISIMLPM